MAFEYPNHCLTNNSIIYLVSLSLFISAHLLQHGLVQVVLVEDDNIRKKLTGDDYTTVVFRYKDINREIESMDEKEILQEIVKALPKVEQIDPEKMKVWTSLNVFSSLKNLLWSNLAGQLLSPPVRLNVFCLHLFLPVGISIINILAISISYTIIPTYSVY